MAKNKKTLFGRIKELLEKEVSRGTLLDAGCGNGDVSKVAYDNGFKVVAADFNSQVFRYNGLISFFKTDLRKNFPFSNEEFDYVTCLEVIEHLENPSFLISELRRVLKKEGCLYLSTPNILNLRSRARFFVEGAFDFFREPPLEILKTVAFPDLDIHLSPLRIQEIEYFLVKNGFRIENIYTDSLLPNAKALSFLIPLIKMQMNSKVKRAKRKGGIDYSRTRDILLSPELLYGRHLIIKARAV